MKKIIAIILAVAVLAVAVFLVIKYVDFGSGSSSSSDSSTSTPATTSATSATTEKKSENVVKLAIDCKILIEKADQVTENIKPLVPESGYILEETEFEFKEGETAQSLIERVAKEKKINLNVDTKSGFFVNGINNINMGDVNAKSFWSLMVNGESSQVGAGEVLLKKDDKIAWVFLLSWD